MRAVRVEAFGGPGVLRVVTDVPIPTPGAGEVLVRVRAVGVNPVETYIRQGTYARLPKLPYTPGHDCAGQVVALGPDAAAIGTLRVGDTVYSDRTTTGSYAEFAVVPAARAHLFPSDGLGFNEAAAIPTPYFTAYRALFQKARARPGDWVLVHGASGGVGIAAVQLAANAGCRVIGTAGTEAGRALVLSQGAMVACPHGSVDEVLKATGGSGVHHIVEMLSNENLDKDLRMLAPGGSVAVVGARGPVEITPRDLMSRESSIVGVSLAFASDADVAEAAAHIGALVRSGRIKPVVGSVFKGLEGAVAAQEEVISHATGSRGKILLELS